MANGSKKGRMAREDPLVRALAEEFGRNVRRVREKERITQAALAYMLGHASHTRVSDIERGVVSVGMREMVRIARALDVENLGELLDFGKFDLADYPEGEGSAEASA